MGSILQGHTGNCTVCGKTTGQKIRMKGRIVGHICTDCASNGVRFMFNNYGIPTKIIPMDGD